MPRFVIEKFQKNLGSFKRDFFRDRIIKFARIIGNLITSRVGYNLIDRFLIPPF